MILIVNAPWYPIYLFNEQSVNMTIHMCILTVYGHKSIYPNHMSVRIYSLMYRKYNLLPKGS